MKLPSIVLFAVLLLTGTATGAGAQAFSDVTSGPLGFLGNSTCGVWGDYDNDGDLDLFLSTYANGNMLFRNDGISGFVDVSSISPALTSPEAYCRAGVWVDYDNDGDLDLYLTYNIGNSLLRNDGGSVFVDVTTSALANAVGAGEHTRSAWADFDNDGDLDLYVTRNSQPGSANALIRNDNGTFVNLLGNTASVEGNFTGIAWGDYDNDGDEDLFVSNWAGSNRLFRNDGNGAFVDVTSGPLADVGGYSLGAVWGDYDNDGDLDLYVLNEFDGSHPSKLLRNDGCRGFVDMTSAVLGVSFAWSASWGDYDNDGDLDLYVARAGYPNKLLRNDGAGVFVDATSGPLANVIPPDPMYGSGVAWGDYDNDGDLDLYLTNYGIGVNASNRLFRNDNANGNHWLKVKLVGSLSNKYGIGARVRVIAGGVTQSREVSSGAGLQSQSAVMAAFGLGSATSLTALEIRWPSGIVQTVSPLPGVDGTVTVTESGMPCVPPRVTSCLPDVTIQCGDSTDPSSTGTITAAGTGVSISYSDAVAPGSGSTRVITRTWTAAGTCGTASFVQTITVTNADTQAPVVTITAPGSGAIFALGTAVSFDANFTDNSGGPHIATWTLDAISLPGTVVEGSPGTVHATYTFTAAGVYMVQLTVTDPCGNTGTATQINGMDAMVVIYDPSAGFVTGGGWINSPPGAYLANPLLTGRANFGFESKYKKGASVPTGETEFQYKVGNLNFHSTSYDWLVVGGAKAQYKGSGTINNTGDYSFILTAIDGQVSGGGGADKFRIKITNKTGGGLVYDNLLNAPDSNDPTTVLGGGSIVIHSSGGPGPSALMPGGAEYGFTAPVPVEYGLSANYPNPFDRSTLIDFSLPERSRVTLVVYDLIGREVRTLVDGVWEPGSHSATLRRTSNNGTLNAGVYFVRMNAQALVSGKSFTSTSKLLIVR